MKLFNIVLAMFFLSHYMLIMPYQNFEYSRAVEDTDNNVQLLYKASVYDAGLGRRILTCDFFTHEDASDPVAEWLFNNLKKNKNIINVSPKSLDQVQKQQFSLFEELVHKKYYLVSYEVFLDIEPIDKDSRLKHYRYILYTKDCKSAITQKLSEIFGDSLDIVKLKLF